MKKIFLPFFAVLLLIACSSDKNSQTFIDNATGKYLFNADEKIEVYFKEAVLHIKWRKQDIKPLKVNDSTFYVQPMNEKLIFTNNQIKLAKKREHKNKTFVFTKLNKGEKTPSEYLAEDNYDKALEAYQAIKARDSLNPVIQRRNLNRIGFRFQSANQHDKAIAVFKITTVLYPKSSYTFSRLGDAYLRAKDSTNAIQSYKKSLGINPENRNAKRELKRLTKK